MKNIYLLGVLIIILIGCNTKRVPQQTIALLKTDYPKNIFKANLPELQGNKSIDKYIVDTINGSPVLIFTMTINDSILYFLDITTKQLYHQISLPYHYISAFHIFSKDSILVKVSNTNFEDGNVDSTLFLMNYKGNIYKYFLLQDSILYCSLNKNKKQSDLYFPSTNFNNFFFIDTYKIFLPMLPVAEDSFPPKLAYYDILQEKLVISKSMWNPLPKECKCYYPYEYYNITYAQNTPAYHPVFIIGYRPAVYEWNVLRDTVITHKIRSYLVDSILPMPSPQMDISITNAMFHSIIYNPYTQQYYLSIMFSEGYGHATEVMILNHNFDIIAEALKPKMGTVGNYTILKDGMLSVAYYSPIFKDTLFINKAFFPKLYGIANIDSLKNMLDSMYNPQLDEFKQYLQTCQVAQGDTSLQEIDYKPFIDRYITVPPKDSFWIISVHPQAGCPSCTQSILNFISANKDFLQDKKDWFLFIFSNDKQSVKKLLSVKMLDLLPQIIIVSTSGTNKYFVTGKNPRLTIVKNGKITFDKIYQHDNPTKIQDKIFEFYHLD